MIHVIIALQEVGVNFIPGEKSNKRILEYFHSCGQDWVTNDETPWCAAFLNFILKKAGMENSGRLNARSFLEIGKETKYPTLGDLVILWRGSKEGVLGHCGIFISEVENTIYILGGNEDGMVKIKGYSSANLLGYRQISPEK